MKNDNLYWGYKKIQGELLKLDIRLDKNTIRNILSDFRRKGKIRQSLTWKQFLSVQIHSFYGMDFFTIDTMVKQRFYVFFIIYHQTREIVQFTITQNPCRELVRQQLIEFGDQLNSLVYLIHDNAAQFNLNYLAYGIKEIRTIGKSAQYECDRGALCRIRTTGSAGLFSAYQQATDFPHFGAIHCLL